MTRTRVWLLRTGAAAVLGGWAAYGLSPRRAVVVALVVALAALAWFSPRGSPPYGGRGARWVPCLAALPLLAWLGAIWAFWPGILSNDSVDQLHQVHTGKFSDWQPVGHTLLLMPIRAFGIAPAVWLAAQVVIVAALVAYSYENQRREGLPGWGIALSALSLACAPPLVFMFATVWRDVTFAVLLLGVGLALQSRRNLSTPRLVALGLCLFGVSMVRHNGALVAAVCVGLACVAGSLRPRQGLGMSLLLGAAVLLARGPGFEALGVERKAGGYQVVAHHVAAHLEAGTRIEPLEASFLSTISPLEDRWRYTCWSAFPTVFDQSFDSQAAREHQARLLALALRLAGRAPGVTGRHVWCLSRLTWAITYRDTWLYRTDARLVDGELRYVTPNLLGLVERALITGITGQDGSYLAELLLDKGYEVTASSAARARRTTGASSTCSTASAAPGRPARPALAHPRRAVRPDEVYNLAAMSFVPASWDQPMLTGEFNSQGVTRVLEAIRRWTRRSASTRRRRARCSARCARCRRPS
jgi:hypothetical protein